MKSTEVYRVLRNRLGPWCKSEGFRRTRGGMLGWYRPRGDQQLVWLRYGREEDVEAWAEFLLSRMPRMVPEFETQAES